MAVMGMVARAAGAAMFLLLVGCSSQGVPPPPGTPDHHRPGGFRNVPHADGADALDFLADRTHLAVVAEPPHGADPLATNEALAGWQAAGGENAVLWLGHAGVLLRLAGVTLAVDPVLGRRVSPVAFAGPRRSIDLPFDAHTMPRLDGILITHDHYDHLEIRTVERLAARDGAACLMPLRVGTLHRVACAMRDEMDWHAQQRIGPIRVTLLPAQHESGRGLFDRNATLWGGWLIEGGGTRVYVTGDTGYGPHFAAAARRYGPADLVILSVGGFHPRYVNENMHMDPEEAVRAVQDLGGRRMMLVHWGTYPMGREDTVRTPDLVRALARAAGIAEADVWVPRIGETRRLPTGSDRRDFSRPARSSQPARAAARTTLQAR